MDKMKVWFQNSKNVAWLSAGIVVVLIVVIILLVMRSPKNPKEVVVENPGDAALVAENKAPTYYHQAAASAAQSGPKLSYDEAVRKYGSNRIQFGDNCSATPITSVFKTGSQVMIDNRSTEAKVFNVDGATYSVAARDYSIVSLVTSKPSQEVFVDCGTMQNVATVTVQK